MEKGTASQLWGALDGTAGAQLCQTSESKAERRSHSVLILPLPGALKKCEISKDTWEAKRWRTFLGAEGQISIPQQAPGPCGLAAAPLGGMTGNGMVGTGVELNPTLLPECCITGEEMGLGHREEGASIPSTSPRGWQVGALHITGMMQTSPCRRAVLYLPIQMCAHLKPSQLSPDVHPFPLVTMLAVGTISSVHFWVPATLLALWLAHSHFLLYPAAGDGCLHTSGGLFAKEPLNPTESLRSPGAPLAGRGGGGRRSRKILQRGPSTSLCRWLM